MGAAGVVQCLDCSLVYEPTGWRRRRCNHCGMEWGETLIDPCIGRPIKGVSEACCGHGVPGNAYIIFDDGRRLGGFERESIMRAE